MRGFTEAQASPVMHRKLQKIAEKVSNRRFATRKHAQGVFTRLASPARLHAIIFLLQGIAAAVRQELGVTSGRQGSERRKR